MAPMVQLPSVSPLSDPFSFSPSSSAIWLNILWSPSLFISLTCALLTMLLQPWACRYLRTTIFPHKRARIRTFSKVSTNLVSMGCFSTSRAAPRLDLPFLCCSCHIHLRRQPYCLQDHCILYICMHRSCVP
ncbi:hypothetical protein BC834DRAFT_503488 [Gloeopeniophorella convolvens]|nr:hypothetical protein BC834DRAFT_503488 [Gloeopeniophorella convolvens]